MDSINKNQPEENKKDLMGSEGIEKIKEIAKKAAAAQAKTNGAGGNGKVVTHSDPEQQMQIDALIEAVAQLQQAVVHIADTIGAPKSSPPPPEPGPPPPPPAAEYVQPPPAEQSELPLPPGAPPQI